MIARLLKLYFLFSITTVFLFACKKADEPIVYKYGVFLGAPKEYNLLFAGHRSYFYRQFQDIETGEINEKRVSTFPTMGDFIGGFWRNKSEVTAGSNKAEFPTGIYLHWYSLFEKQGWEIKYDFDEKLMGRINTHHFSDIFTGGKSKITHPQRFFGFNIYIMPKGLAYVYISGGGESYLLGELQANPVDVNFDYYRRTLHSLTEETAEDLFNRRLSYQTEEFQKAYHDGTLSFSTEKWERRMKRYNWELVGNSFYKIKGPFNAVYTNAEMYNIYEEGKNTFHDRHAPPNHMTVYLEGTELSPNPGRVERVRFKFDDDHIMEVFEVMKAVDPEAKMTLEIDMSADFKSHRLVLANGDKAVRLRPSMFYIEDIPEHYKPVIEDPNYKMPSVDLK